MNANLTKRIEKLENRRRNDDEVLFLWLCPGTGIDAAVIAAKKAGILGAGDLVICVDWIGEGTPPKPRWLKRVGDRFTDQEEWCIHAMLEKRIAAVEAGIATGGLPEFEHLVKPLPRDLSELSSIDLAHYALGVKT